MITNIEIKACEALIGISRTLREKRIDWEQRRYEVAKEIFLATTKDTPAEKAAELAIHEADVFITALKERMGIETNDQSEL